MHKHRIAAIIVCYHPNKEQLYSNIAAFADHVDTILLWRNSEMDISFPTEWQERIILLGDGNNQYIAKALNEAIQWCIANQVDYLLTMDQDSVWENFEELVANVGTDKQIAIYAPNVNHSYPEGDCSPRDVDSVITSGSLIDVRIANSIGGFREDYEIYWVDGEYCYWARRNGFRIVVFPDCHLKHELGKQTKTLFGYYTSNYSPTVYYYTFRNMLWMHREHGSKAVSIKCILYTSLYNIRGIILGERNKIKKLSKIAQAFLTGLFQRIPQRRTLPL